MKTFSLIVSSFILLTMSVYPKQPEDNKRRNIPVLAV